MGLPNRDNGAIGHDGIGEPLSTSTRRVVVLGGGLAGLSLSCHLLERAGDRVDITVLESRERYVHDRNWCTWYPLSHPFPEAVTHRWHKWEVARGSERVVCEAPGLPYQRISSGRLYETAVDRLRGAGHRVELGRRVVGVDVGRRGVTVVDATGESVSADVVFDARPAPPPPAQNPPAPSPPGQSRRPEVDLVQHFVGWQVKTEHPVFEPDTVNLMDFLGSDGGVRFIYALPFSDREALVESTGFSPQSESDDAHGERIRDWLGQRLGLREFEIVHTERGAIPMSSRSPVSLPPGPVHRIGAAGGMIKPSSGYSFDPIQRACLTIAEQVATGSPVRVPSSQNHLERALDRVFLSFMLRHPEQLPEVFVQLFRDVPADRLVRFLSDRAGPGDLMAVIRAMPAAAMTGEALRSIPLWARP